MKATAVAVLAVIASLGLHVSQRSSAKMSDLVLANIEALATGESGGQTLKCYKTVSSGGGGMMTHVTYCGTCSAVWLMHILILGNVINACVTMSCFYFCK